VRRRVFPLHSRIEDEIVTTHRFLLILRGTLRYTVEGRTCLLRAGTQFLVPAWVRRVWTIPRGGPCEMIWCEFDADAPDAGGGVCFRRVLTAREPARERAVFAAMLRRHQQAGAWRDLRLEGRPQGHAGALP
jgi:hypothetical protein